MHLSEIWDMSYNHAFQKKVFCSFLTIASQD